MSHLTRQSRKAAERVRDRARDPATAREGWADRPALVLDPDTAELREVIVPGPPTLILAGHYRLNYLCEERDGALWHVLVVGRVIGTRYHPPEVAMVYGLAVLFGFPPGTIRQVLQPETHVVRLEGVLHPASFGVVLPPAWQEAVASPASHAYAVPHDQLSGVT